MKLLVVEDDFLQAQWIESSLAKGFKGAKIHTIGTELEFRNILPRIASDGYDVIVLDVILPWTEPGEVIEDAPSEVKINGRYRAGLRCQAMLQAQEATRRIPVVLYTVLEHGDVADSLTGIVGRYVYLNKHANPKPLIDAVKRFVQA